MDNGDIKETQIPRSHSLTSYNTTQMEPRLDSQGIQMSVPAT